MKKNMSMPWNRPEDAVAREFFKKTLLSRDVKPFSVEKAVYQTKYEFRRFSPDIFKEVSNEEAYKMYQDSVQRL